jgi:hypothetical protein
VLPPPAILPPAERRRASRVVRLTLAIGLEAAAHAGADVGTLATVFAASGADGHNCHALCEQLASDDRQISPTRFHNSVHNAAAGYWGIATGSMAPCQVLCAFDASFGAGLLDALGQVVVDQQPTLLIAYDSEYPEPLHSKRPVPDCAGVALLLTPAGSRRSLARITVTPTTEPAQAWPMPDWKPAPGDPGDAQPAAAGETGPGRVGAGLPRLPAADATERRRRAMLDHAAIAARIPHQGSMCLLAAVVDWSADGISCRAVSHADPANPLRAEGRLGAANGIEYAAQAMALHGALLAGGDAHAAPGLPDQRARRPPACRASRRSAGRTRRSGRTPLRRRRPCPLPFLGQS